MSQQRQAALADQASRRKDQAKRKIWITFQKVGFHRYPAAATDPALCSAGEYDVSYLAARHRHLFKFKVEIEIFHNDRELEFHQCLIFCESLFDNTIETDYKSVEMLGDDLYAELVIKYPGREMVIEVSEDGECGCRIEYPLIKPAQSILI